MANSNKPILQALPLFVVIFIDTVGLGLIYPILSSVMLEKVGGILPEHVTMANRQLLYGFVAGVFMLAWFFGSAYISDLSDVIGRKKALFICLMGSLIGYVITGFAIITHSLLWLIIGRVIDGFTAGSQPVAQASTMDIAPADKKNTYMGYVLLASTLGFVAGPILGGILVNKDLVSWFSYDKPMFFAAIVSGVNIILLLWLYRESFTPKPGSSAKLGSAVRLFSLALKIKAIRQAAIYYMLFVAGWASFYTYLPVYALQVFNLAGKQSIYMMATLGLGFAIGNVLLVRLCKKTWKPVAIISITWILSAFFATIFVLTHSIWVLHLMAVALGAVVALGYVYIVTVFSSTVDSNHQGLIMGILGAVMALSFAVVQFSGGVLLGLGHSAPIWFCVICLFVAGVLIGFYKEKPAAQLTDEV